MINPISAYYDGALKAAFSVFLFNGVVREQHIDGAKELVSRFRESEIDNMSVSQDQKDEMKAHWKLCLESYVQGVKDELRREGRLVL